LKVSEFDLNSSEQPERKCDETFTTFQSPEDKIVANLPSVVYIQYTSGAG